jgi:hypothetical protein
MNCRYNLRTLEPHSVCPECGTRVRRTLAAIRVQESPVYAAARRRHRSPYYAAIAVALVYLGTVFALAIGLGDGPGMSSLFALVLFACGVLALVCLVGCIDAWLHRESRRGRTFAVVLLLNPLVLLTALFELYVWVIVEWL